MSRGGAGNAIAAAAVAFTGYLYISGRLGAVWQAIFGTMPKPNSAPSRTNPEASTRFGTKTLHLAGPRCPMGRIIPVDADNCLDTATTVLSDCGVPSIARQQIAIAECSRAFGPRIVLPPVGGGPDILS